MNISRPATPLRWHTKLTKWRPIGSLFILIRSHLCVHETKCSQDSPKRPEVRGFSFDVLGTVPQTLLNYCQGLLAPLLAFIPATRSATHVAKSAKQKKTRICKTSPRIIQKNDGTKTRSTIHPPCETNHNAQSPKRGGEGVYAAWRLQ